MANKTKLKADPEGTVIKDSAGNDVGISYNKTPTWLSSTPKTSRDQATVKSPAGGSTSGGNTGSSSGSNSTTSKESDYINKVADLQKVAKQSEYENAYNKVMSQIEEARAKTKAEYQAQRNDADVANQIQQKNYFENVANRGQTNSGSTSQGELALKIAGMNNQSTLQSGQAQAMADLNRDANNAYSDYVNNVVQSNANIDIQRYQNLLEQYRIDQEKASKEAKEAFQREVATIAQYDSDYAAEIQRREALDPNDPLIPYLKIARQEKLDELERGLQEKEKAQQEAQKERIKQAMDVWETKGYATQEVADILNIPVGTKTGDYAYKQASLAKKNSSGSSSGSGSGQNKTANYNSIYEDALKMKTSDDINYAYRDIVAYILNQGLTEEQEYQMIGSLGLLEFM